ncbi:MAG: type II toxin-antitoxin system HicA family toxin [Kiritimatiellae bacterium]|nr:type II toxin-antitoxin system HicA family toxin [Kiritimatiellia bacterium]
MPELPRLSGKEAIRVFERLGFHPVRQRGSHVVLRRGDKGCTIPMHNSLAIGTLRGALRQAGVVPDLFVAAHRNA